MRSASSTLQERAFYWVTRPAQIGYFEIGPRRLRPIVYLWLR